MPPRDSEEERAPRSRAYPVLHLSAACELLRTGLAGLEATPLKREDLVRRLGYNSVGGGLAARKVAALVHYGILTRTTQGYALSERGVHLKALPIESPDYKRLLRSAFEEPILFRSILEHYQPSGRIPAPLDLAPILTSAKFGMVGAASEEAAQVFWRSATFAGVIAQDGSFVDPSPRGDTRQAPSGGEALSYTIPLSGGSARFEMPQPYTQEDVLILGQIINTIMAAFRARVGLGQVLPHERPRRLKNDESYS